MTFLRSISLDIDVEAVATVVHMGRRLAVIDCEIGSADSRPCALAQVIATRTTHP
jgi:acyl-coenzyme A thioesterase PaaI-like protein